jgi:cytochrome d ubiquinol oxidase subunit II
VSRAEICALILWLGATLYAVFGGADFGAGIWDLLLGRGKTKAKANAAKAVRQRIDHSLAPVWEANHVWLIFILVVLWTAFPEAFYAIMTTLYIPIALAALGIVLRGAGFAFRHAIEGPWTETASRVFAAASLITPFFRGCVVGAIASGEVPREGYGDPTGSWIGVLPFVIGVLFVAGGAYLAAVFLTHDAKAAGEKKVAAYFDRRALVSAVVAGLLSLGGIFALREEARYVFDGLVGPGLPLVIFSVLAGGAAFALLALKRYEILVRPLAVGALVAVVWGWYVAQHPYLLPTSLTIDQAAGAYASLLVVIIVFLVAAVLVLPSLALLYVLSQKRLLED